MLANSLALGCLLWKCLAMSGSLCLGGLLLSLFTASWHLVFQIAPISTMCSLIELCVDALSNPCVSFLLFSLQSGLLLTSGSIS